MQILASYCDSLTHYSRRQTRPVMVGDLGIGSDFPIRIQSMTTLDTMDTQGSVDQSIRMIESGCELIRITAPSVKEAQNLENIKKSLRAAGYNTPLVADIHFTPNAAELAARIVEKVRINPGNYADKKRFEYIEYTDSTYNSELDRIRDKFLPLIKICKEYGTAMRIGTNHGSLSDRILSRYGDTPVGMVESALEFLRICEDENYYNIVISMKSSNPIVMVHAYRLLCKRLEEEKLQAYPLHLGVTEAGEGEDGRIKSSLGIGTLLEDGLGDTVRVSLTEDPEFEAPVAKALVNRYTLNPYNYELKETTSTIQTPYSYSKHTADHLFNFGGLNVPRVISNYSESEHVQPSDLKDIGHYYLSTVAKWRKNDLGSDFIYTGSRPLDFDLSKDLIEIQDFAVWQKKADKIPLYSFEQYFSSNEKHPEINFVKLDTEKWNSDLVPEIKQLKNTVLILHSKRPNAFQEFRGILLTLVSNNISIPIVLSRDYTGITLEDTQIFAATDIGGVFLEGFGDGIMLSGITDKKASNNLSFGILQAARTRITKTEFISCPSCGRTLFDLQETTAMIRERTEHLKGVKIGIMGCIVNGPGEMADADYGYVGVGKDKIALYRGQHVIKKSVSASKAVEELINLIKEDGKWCEPEQIEQIIN